MKGLAMSKAEIPIVKRSLFSWILAGNLKLQLMLLFIIVIMVVTRVLPLEMQKRIINEAINLRSIDNLLLYCGFYLVAVFLFSALKYLTNIIQTLITQRTTARMRKALYHHILTLPLNFFRKTQPGTVVNALSTELTLPGNFVGMAVASPLNQHFDPAGFCRISVLVESAVGSRIVEYLPDCGFFGAAASKRRQQGQ